MPTAPPNRSKRWTSTGKYSERASRGARSFFCWKRFEGRSSANVAPAHEFHDVRPERRRTTTHRQDCPCYYQTHKRVVAWAILPVWVGRPSRRSRHRWRRTVDCFGEEKTQKENTREENTWTKRTSRVRTQNSPHAAGSSGGGVVCEVGGAASKASRAGRVSVGSGADARFASAILDRRNVRDA